MVWSLLAEISQRPSGVASRRLTVLVCPSRRRAGPGAGAPALSGRSQTRICPLVLPAATRLGPTKLTDVTQPAFQGSDQTVPILSPAGCPSADPADQRHQLASSAGIRKIARRPDLCNLDISILVKGAIRAGENQGGDAPP